MACFCGDPECPSCGTMQGTWQPRTLEEMARQGAALLLKRVPRPPTHRCPECADDVVGEHREDLRGVGHVECEVCGERLTDADLIEGAD